MAVLGLRFCVRAFSSCGKWGPLFITVRGPLTIAASLVVEHRLQTRRLSNCGSRAQSLRGMWDLPRPGLEPVSPALAGRFSTTAPPGKPLKLHFHFHRCYYERNFYFYVVKYEDFPLLFFKKYFVCLGSPPLFYSSSIQRSEEYSYKLCIAFYNIIFDIKI